MDLGTLIEKLSSRGNQFLSWYEIETNIKSVGQVKEENGKYTLQLEINNE